MSFISAKAAARWLACVRNAGSCTGGDVRIAGLVSLLTQDAELSTSLAKSEQGLGNLSAYEMCAACNAW